MKHKDFEVKENALTEDLDTFEKYFRKWRLQPSAAKTEAAYFT